MSQDQNSQFNINPNVIIGGDITYTIRGSGDVESSSTDPDVICPTNKNVPQITIGIGPYSDLEVSLGLKQDNGSGNDNLNPFNSVGAVGLDGLFTPYTNSRNPDTPFLPHYEEASSSGVGTNSGIFNKSLDPFNPFNSLEEAGQSYTTKWFESGHNISYALYDNPYDPEMTGLYPSGDDAPVDFNFDKDFFARGKAEVSGVRSIALRSPLVLSGWGYDTSGNQVPSDPDAAYNPNKWKTGPLDVRWDDERKVWSAAAKDNGIVVVTSTQVFYDGDGSFDGVITRGGVLGYNVGDSITGILNLFGDNGSNGTLCHVYVAEDYAELIRLEC
jgi:hypothetical protein